MIDLPQLIINLRLSEVASFLNCELVGSDIVLDGFNLSNREIIAKSVLSYCGSERFVRIACKNTSVKALILPKELYDSLEKEQKNRFSFILSDTPEWDFYKAFIHAKDSGIYPSYDWPTKMNDAIVGNNSIIEDGVILGNNVVIGSNTIIKSGTIIGDNVCIGSSSVVGNDGFQLIKDNEGHNHTIPHVGRTYIGNNVTLLDNVTVAKSLFEGYTYLDDYVKADCQAHVAHNCYVGRDSVICANTTLLGSCYIGNNVWIAPNCLILNRAKIGDNAFICAASFVMGNVLRGTKMFGVPAKKVD